jgi:hypothetical protein
MRDLRSALSWLLLRDHSCDDVASEINATPQVRLNNLYYNAFRQNGSPRSGRSEDRLIALLRQIDPALTANPRTDRALHFGQFNRLPTLIFENRSTLSEELLKDWVVPGGWQGHQLAVQESQRERHNLLRRIAYYERRGKEWGEMLPYRNLSRFKTITDTQKGTELSKYREPIGRGFSYVEGASLPSLTRNFVCIRAGQPVKARLRSFRVFPLKEFEIGIPPFKANEYLEHTTDQFVFKHKQKVSSAQEASLSVSLDLLELLEEINNGYVPSPDDISGIFINLLTFKNALAHLPYDQVLLTRDDRRFFKLHQTSDAVLHLGVYEPENGDPS